nr:glycosyl hydrolase family 18 protein [uncultured Sphaerochaeta sp.]
MKKYLLIVFLCFIQINFLGVNTKAQNTNLNKVVFGYLPDWVHFDMQHTNIDYSLLTHLAVFPFTYDSTGNISYPYSWEWADVKTKTEEYDVKLIMSVAEFDSNKIQYLFQNEATRKTFLRNLKNIINEFGFEGVNIDFEHLRNEDEGLPVINFMRELADSIRINFPDAEISFATPIVNWNSDWKLNDLAEICDYLFVMGYGFYGEWSPVTGPVAPLTGGYRNLVNSLENDYSEIISSNPEKIILGFPYFGEEWITKSNTPGDSVSRYVSWASYDRIDSLESDVEEMWSDDFNVSWYRWSENDTTWHQLWIDNTRSLSLKFDLINENNLLGVGIWALGYDHNTDELWNLIEEKFSSPDDTEKKESLPHDYILLNNYPNPFNPSTKINFYLPYAGKTELIIYDLLGQEVVILISDNMSKGWHEINWNGKSLEQKISSGMYICRLIHSGVVLQRKMILIK